MLSSGCLFDLGNPNNSIISVRSPGGIDVKHASLKQVSLPFSYSAPFTGDYLTELLKAPGRSGFS